ncbi:hypothetical protein D3C86_1620490 [compost metagenome]
MPARAIVFKITAVADKVPAGMHLTVTFSGFCISFFFPEILRIYQFRICAGIEYSNDDLVFLFLRARSFTPLYAPF